MRKKIIVRGPALTRSGYGEQTRFALRSLRQYENLFDIYLMPVGWGQTGWISEDDEERSWIDSLVGKTVIYNNNKDNKYDLSLQVTIPQEWEKMASINIGYTAGTETTKISPEWIEKSNIMDRIIAVSNHTKAAFENTKYETVNKAGDNTGVFQCTTPVEVVNFSTRKIKPEIIDLEGSISEDFYDFNFLTIAQWSPRKNLEKTIIGFVEEFQNEEVGLIIKANHANNSILDSELSRRKLKSVLDNYRGTKKCKIYLLHGDLTDNQLAGLYCNPKIKALINLAHGEGFGLPMFEAAQHALPIVAPGWSGHLDFLYAPVTDKKTKKKRMRPHFAYVDYAVQPIQEEAVWDPVLIKNSMWCFPRTVSYKKALRDVYRNYGKYKKQAKLLKTHIDKNFSEEKQNKQFAEAVLGAKVELEEAKYVFVSDMFADQYIGGAELSLQALIDKTPESYTKINSGAVNETILEFYKDSKWIFGNYADLESKTIHQLVDKNIDYNIVEFDYKFCRYRNLELHQTMENKSCDCALVEHGQTVERFLSNASAVFFMSKRQMDIHFEQLEKLNLNKCTVLSSIIDEETIDKIRDLRQTHSKNKERIWAVSGSPHWVKNASGAKEWCKDNNVDFVELNNLPYSQVLETLAKAQGLCFLPVGADTCPRLVIEAKLLGCKLELNEHVQHADEDWFNIDNLEDIEKYLKNVPNRFWEKLAS